MASVGGWFWSAAVGGAFLSVGATVGGATVGGATVGGGYGWRRDGWRFAAIGGGLQRPNKNAAEYVGGVSGWRLAAV